MKTLSQSWSARLAELRAICKANGERLPAILRQHYRRAHAQDWAAAFVRAAWDGANIPPAVWRSAEKVVDAYALARLRVRNDIARPRTSSESALFFSR